jgi:predicted negative regulator of RcsB-dependent stress response
MEHIDLNGTNCRFAVEATLELAIVEVSTKSKEDALKKLTEYLAYVKERKLNVLLEMIQMLPPEI